MHPVVPARSLLVCSLPPVLLVRYQTIMDRSASRVAAMCAHVVAAFAIDLVQRTAHG
jgi:hypothetical protein